MTQRSPQLFCAPCQRPLDGPADADASSRFACPACGEGDSLEAIIREIERDSANKALNDLVDGIGRTARRSKTLSHQPGQKRPVAGRFILR